MYIPKGPIIHSSISVLNFNLPACRPDFYQSCQQHRKFELPWCHVTHGHQVSKRYTASILRPGSRSRWRYAVRTKLGHSICQSTQCLNFKHCAFCILGQAFRYSPENAFYIFNQQIYFFI